MLNKNDNDETKIFDFLKILQRSRIKNEQMKNKKSCVIAIITADANEIKFRFICDPISVKKMEFGSGDNVYLYCDKKIKSANDDDDSKDYLLSVVAELLSYNLSIDKIKQITVSYGEDISKIYEDDDNVK